MESQTAGNRDEVLGNADLDGKSQNITIQGNQLCPT